MLQQTQVSTVIPYFKRFVQKIPNFKKLSKANDQTLMKLWEGLGYYSRARNLKKSAIMINGKFGGTLPSNIEDLKSLPGVGEDPLRHPQRPHGAPGAAPAPHRGLLRTSNHVLAGAKSTP